MRMEGQTVINPPDVTIFIAQAMTSFAIGIVRDQVEKCHFFDFILMLLSQTKIIGIFLAVVDVELHRPDPIRPIAKHRGRDELPAQDFTEEKGSPLASIERAIREIPQRCLTTTRFIDAEHGYPLPNVYSGEKCVIRSPGNQAT